MRRPGCNPGAAPDRCGKTGPSDGRAFSERESGFPAFVIPPCRARQQTSAIHPCDLNLGRPKEPAGLDLRPTALLEVCPTEGGTHERNAQCPFRTAGDRAGTAHRRALCRQDAGRIRRRRHQGGTAGGRRSPAQLAHDQGRHLPLVAGAVTQQTFAGAGPEAVRSPGDRALTGPGGRCPDRELPAGDPGGLGPGLGGTARAQSQAGHAAHLRLRPDRPVPGPARFRGDRRGHGRPAPPHR